MIHWGVDAPAVTPATDAPSTIEGVNSHSVSMWLVRGLIALQISARRRVFALLYPPRTNITSAVPARPVDSCCRRAVALQIVLNTRTSGNRFIAAATNVMRFCLLYTS